MSRPLAGLTQRRLGVAGLLVALAGVLRAEGVALFPARWLNTDEGYASAVAARLVHDGGLPYVNAISIRGPVMYWTYELAARIGGALDVRPVRAAGVLFAVLFVVAAYCAARAAGARLGAGVAALAAAASLTWGMDPADGLALNGELIATPFALLAFACVAGGAARSLLRPPDEGRSRALYAAAGVLGALAFFAKQSLGIHLGLLAVWIASTGAPRWQARAMRLSAFALGACGVAAAVLAPFVATGSVRAFVYYFSTYGREVYLAPTTARKVARLAEDYYVARLHAVPLLACALWIGARRPRWAAGWAAVANAALAVPTAVFTGRYFDHYFVPYEGMVAVALGLAVGAGRPPWLTAAAARRGRVLLAGACAALLVAWPRQKGPDPLKSALPRSALDPQHEPVGRWIEANTRESDRIFVWGLRGDIYTSARRYPASRFTYTLFQSGFVPWIPEPLAVENERVVAGSRARLMDDLEQAHAEIVVDAGGSLMDRYMTTYAPLRTYLEAHYCFATSIASYPIYRRRQAAAACTPIPPPPHPPVVGRSAVLAWIAEQRADGEL